MKRFFRLLKARNPAPRDRRWLYVPYDQLSDRMGPLSREPAGELGIVMLEAPWKAARRPYHKQKLATILANSRHFALEQAERGVAVRYVVSDGSYADGLRSLLEELGPLRVMEPAERELRADLHELAKSGALEVIPHEGWLTTRKQFLDHTGKKPPWRMDQFYRGVRRDTGLLMDERGKPVGGRWSYDEDNREPWKGTPPAPKELTFESDDVTDEVAELLQEKFADHPGELRLEALPATENDAARLWKHGLRKCLPHFGPFEDAMSRKSPHLFHSRVSALVNVSRLLPRELIDDVAKADLPLQSKEGFIRQLLGWREYMHHVHVETDGFRSLPAGEGTRATGKQTRLKTPGDGGYQRWAKRSWPASAGASPMDGGATPSFLGADNPVPPAYWGTPSGLTCLDTVVADVWRDGYSHHITRLMVLSNLAQLLDLSPRDLTDWFWVAYVDAYDWVVEPNVLAMSTFGVGDLATTKPYISGAAYIDRMSDYCKVCRFDPKKNCPFTRMYWAYLARHEEKLRGNHRLAQPLASLRKRTEAQRAQDAAVYELTVETLASEREMAPEQVERLLK